MANVQQAETEPGTGQVRFDGFISYSHTADDLLAPRLQSALQTFAKPWWKRRAVRVFRDQSSLSANPHLWSSITAALDASDWFILLTSPEAAASTWVDREVAYWREHKDPEKILPVLTDGTLTWDEATGRIDPNSSVPPSLRDAFTGEPRWVDLRWAEEETQLDLRNGRFREVVADIASSLRGIPKDDLESEEVRQHRRTRRTAWGAGIALAILAVAAVTGAVIAVDQREQAETQRALAEAETVRAESAESLARSRELAASAINVLDDDPELSILLGLEAIQATPQGAVQPTESLSALREAVHASRLRSRTQASPEGGWVVVDLTPDGSRLAVIAQLEGAVSLVEPDKGDTVWSFSDPNTVDSFFASSFSPDGTLLAVGVVDSALKPQPRDLLPLSRPGANTDDGLPPRVLLLRVDTGELIHTIEYPSCIATKPMPSFSPDGAWLAIAGVPADCETQGEWMVELFDTRAFDAVHRWTTPADRLLSWSGDGSRLAIGSINSSEEGSSVIDVRTGQRVLDIPRRGGIISTDGSYLVVEARTALDVIEVTTGAQTDHLVGLEQLVVRKMFTPDGSRLIVGTGADELVIFDFGSGEVIQRLGPAGVPVSFSCQGRCDTLYQSTYGGELLTWDLSGTAGGELNSIATDYWINADSITTAGPVGAFLGFPPDGHPEVVPFDRLNGRLHTARRSTETNSPVALPDGRIVLLEVSDVAPEWGPVVAWDPDTDAVEEIVGCWTTQEAMVASGYASLTVPACVDREGSYFYLDRAFLSPDESSLLIAAGADVRLLDLESFDLSKPTLPEGQVAVLAYGGAWLLTTDGTMAYVVDILNGEVLATLAIGSVDSWAVVSSGGDLVAIAEGGSPVTVYATGTWKVVSSFETGSLRGLALSADGSMLLTAGSDGYARVWNTQHGEELARIPLPAPSDGYWLDESHVVVGTITGLWTTVTLDLEELTDLAVSRLTRGFTAEECEAYRIEPCPDLAAIRGG